LTWIGAIRGFKAGLVLSSIYTAFFVLLAATSAILREGSRSAVEAILGSLFFVGGFGFVLGVLPATLLGSFTGSLISEIVCRLLFASRIPSICAGLVISSAVIAGFFVLFDLARSREFLAFLAIPFVTYFTTSGWMGLAAWRDLQQTQAGAR
jgi:hypothetical protein